jgi:hypothetical protein
MLLSRIYKTKEKRGMKKSKLANFPIIDLFETQSLKKNASYPIRKGVSNRWEKIVINI